jgi:hypothetical protein
MYIHPCIGSPGWGRCCCCCCCRRRSGRGAAAALRIGVESATPCGRGRAVWGGGVSLSTGAGNASLAPLFERTAARQRRTSARWWRARHARWRTRTMRLVLVHPVVDSGAVLVHVSGVHGRVGLRLNGARCGNTRAYRHYWRAIGGHGCCSLCTTSLGRWLGRRVQSEWMTRVTEESGHTATVEEVKALGLTYVQCGPPDISGFQHRSAPC